MTQTWRKTRRSIWNVAWSVANTWPYAVRKELGERIPYLGVYSGKFEYLQPRKGFRRPQVVARGWLMAGQLERRRAMCVLHILER